MSNSYFRFKQFTIEQDRCAMKVSTDACIQGAWTPIATDAKHVLDIGAGTGLLSLMIAQRAPQVSIDALEMDAETAAQASDNAAASAFADRIHVTQVDATKWQPAMSYDLIICNPPFFQNALKGPDAARNQARHSGALDMPALIELTQCLAPNGIASFLWPRAEHDIFVEKANAAGLYLIAQLNIRHLVRSVVSRVVGIYSRMPSSPVIENLVIKDETDNYTEQFIKLLSPFYLNL
jgi:tRNA1Val (adenine37-N6)-methyltransferase